MVYDPSFIFEHSAVELDYSNLKFGPRRSSYVLQVDFLSDVEKLHQVRDPFQTFNHGGILLGVIQ